MKQYGWDERPYVAKWLRSPTVGPTWADPDIYSAFGLRNSGKSTMLQAIALAHYNYPESKISVIDAYSATDSESCAIAMSPEYQDKVTLLVGDGVDVKFMDKRIDVLQAKEFTMKDLERHRYYIAIRPTFSPRTQRDSILYFNFLEKLTEMCHWRTTYNPRFSDIWICRETQQYLGSRALLSGHNMSTRDAMQGLVTLADELAHVQFAFGLDRLRRVSLSKDLRETISFEFVKRIGAMDISEIKYVMAYVDINFLRMMPPNFAVMLGANSGIGVVKIPFPPWGKYPKSGVDLLDKLGIRINYDEAVIRRLVQETLPTQGGPLRQVDQSSHEEIVRRVLKDGETRQSVSLKGLSNGEKWSLNTVKKELQKHELGQCNCEETGI